MTENAKQPTWDMVESNENFQKLPNEQKRQVYRQYHERVFKAYVEPKAPAEQLDALRQRYFERAKVDSYLLDEPPANDAAEPPAIEPPPAPNEIQPEVNTETEKPSYWSNNLRSAGERVADLAGAGVEAIGQAGAWLDEKASMGGFVFGENGMPRYAGPEEWKTLKEQGMTDMVKSAGEGIKDTSFGYEARHTWESTKDAWRQGVGSGIAETFAAMGEVGTTSLADMGAAVFMFPGYIGMRAQEMGEAQAKNKGKETEDFTDTLNALPFAVASSFLERVVPGKVWGSLTGKAKQKAGAEATAHAIRTMKGRVKDVAGTMGKRGLQEAGTEAIQEGLIEYVGERWGTDAKIKASEMLDRAAGGAVLGGGPGAALGGIEASFQQMSAPARERSERKQRFIADEMAELESRMANGEIIGPKEMAYRTDPDLLASRAERLEKSGELAKRYTNLKAPQDHEHDIKTFDERQKQQRFEQFVTEQTLAIEQQIEAGETEVVRPDHNALVEQFEAMEASGESRQRYPTESYTDVELSNAEQEMQAARSAPKTVEQIIETGGDLAEADMTQFDHDARKRIEGYTKRYADHLKVDPNENPQHFKELVNQAVELEHSGHLEVLSRLTEAEQRELLKQQLQPERDRAFEVKEDREAAKRVDVVAQGIAKHLGGPTSKALQQAHDKITGYTPPNTAMADALMNAAGVTPDQVLAPEPPAEPKPPKKTNKLKKKPPAPAKDPVIENLETVVATDKVAAALGVKVNPVKSAKALPKGLKRNALRDPETGQIEAVLDSAEGVLHLVGKGDPDTVVRKALTEVVGKKGVPEAAGRKLDIPLSKVYQLMDARQRASHEQGLEDITNPQERRRRAAESYVIANAIANPASPVLKPAIDGTRRWLKDSFGDVKFSNEQILKLWRGESVVPPKAKPEELSPWDRKAKALGRQPTPKIPEGFAPKRIKQNPPKPKPVQEKPVKKEKPAKPAKQEAPIEPFVKIDEISTEEPVITETGGIDTSNVLGKEFVQVLVGQQGIRKAAAPDMEIPLSRLYKSIPKATADALNARMKERVGKKKREIRERMIAEEFARQLARHAPDNPLTTRLVADVGRWLKKKYSYAQFTDAEIIAMLAGKPAVAKNPVKQATPKTEPAKPKPEPVAEVETEVEAETEVEPETEPAAPLSKAEIKAREKTRKAVERAKAKLRKAEQTAEQRAEINEVTGKRKPLPTLVRDFLKRHVAPGGNMPRRVHDAWVRRNGEVGALDLDASMHIDAMEAAVRKGYGHMYHRLSEEAKRDIKNAIQSRATDPNMPPLVREAAEIMRQYIDNLSERYAKGLRVEIRQLINRLEQGSQDAETISRKLETLHAIEQNAGAYLHRAYEVFDNPNWHKKVDDKVVTRAIDFLTDQYAGEGEITAEHVRKARHTVAVLLQKDHKYSSLSSMVRESNLGAMDLKALMKKTKIPWQIRALMGEYQDPRIAYAQTTAKLGQLVFNQEFLNYMRDTGMNNFLFEKHNAPPWANQQIAAEGSETYAPLNGLYTSKEVIQALKDQMETRANDDSYGLYIKLTGYVKYGLTIGGFPAGPIRNWLGSAFQMVANGHNPVHIIGAFKVMDGYFANKGKSIPYLRMLQREGIIHDTARGQTLKDLQEDMGLVNMLTQKTGMRWPKKIENFLQRFYEAGDDFWKIVGYEAEKARQIKWGGLTEEQAHIVARDRIRNNYLTYSQVGHSVKLLRRAPTFGSFPSFTAEVYRTQGNMLGYLYKDLKENPVVGMQRLVGMSIAWGGVYALGQALRSWNDVDDDEDWAVRELGPEWYKTGDLHYTGRDDKGRLRYFDMTYYNIYGVFWRIAKGIEQGEGIPEKMKTATFEALSPLMDVDITTQAFLDVAANKTNSGAPIYNEQDPYRHFLKAAYLLKNISPSGPRRFYAAAEQTDSPDFKSKLHPERKDVDDAWLSVMGFTMATADPVMSLRYRALDYRYRYDDITKLVSSQFRNTNANSEATLLKAQDKARLRHYQSYVELAKAVKAAQILGVDDQTILDLLDNAPVSPAILSGQIDPFNPSQKSMENAIEAMQENYVKAGASFIDETTDMNAKLQILWQDVMDNQDVFYLDKNHKVIDVEGRRVKRFEMPSRKLSDDALPATKDLNQ